MPDTAEEQSPNVEFAAETLTKIRPGTSATYSRATVRRHRTANASNTRSGTQKRGMEYSEYGSMVSMHNEGGPLTAREGSTNEHPSRNNRWFQPRGAYMGPVNHDGFWGGQPAYWKCESQYLGRQSYRTATESRLGGQRFNPNLRPRYQPVDDYREWYGPQRNFGHSGNTPGYSHNGHQDMGWESSGMEFDYSPQKWSTYTRGYRPRQYQQQQSVSNTQGGRFPAGNNYNRKQNQNVAAMKAGGGGFRNTDFRGDLDFEDERDLEQLSIQMRSQSHYRESTNYRRRPYGGRFIRQPVKTTDRGVGDSDMVLPPQSPPSEPEVKHPPHVVEGDAPELFADGSSFFHTVKFGHSDQEIFATSQVGCFYDGINRELERVMLQLAESRIKEAPVGKLHKRVTDESITSWTSRHIPSPQMVVLGPAHQFYCRLSGRKSVRTNTPKSLIMSSEEYERNVSFTAASGEEDDKAVFRCNSGSTSLLNQIQRDPLAMEFLTFGFKPDSYFCLTADQIYHNRLPATMVATMESEMIDVEFVQLWRGDGWFIKATDHNIYFENIPDQTLIEIFDRQHPYDPVEYFSISLNGLNWYVRTASQTEFYKSRVLRNFQRAHDPRFSNTDHTVGS